MAALLVSACGAQPSPTAPGTPSVPGSPSPSPSPSPRYADTIRIANRDGRATSMSNVAFGLPLGAATLVHSALYRWAPDLDAVPDLADGPCQPQGDGTVIRCHLIEATFDDGTPVSADDVAYSYQLRATDSCFPTQFSPCLGKYYGVPTYRDARVVDARTVEFTLSRPDPTFLTTVLPAIAIESRRVVEASYARFLRDAKGVDRKALADLEDAIDEETQRDPPVCTAHVDAVKALLSRFHVPWYTEDFTFDHGFEPCFFSFVGRDLIDLIIGALRLRGQEAVEAAYPALSLNWNPVGAGPYRLVSQTSDATLLEASPTYHGIRPATRYVRLVPTRDDGSDLVATGLVDIAPDLETLDVVKHHPDAGLLPIEAPQPSYVALHYNVRPGFLFADRNLRLALQECVDLKRIIDAATGDGRQAIASPFMPGSLGYDTDLPIPPRDVARAKGLIEASGWSVGPDGVYTKGGRRLAARIVVRGDSGFGPRAKTADLIALQARDCGMDLASMPVRFDEDIRALIAAYPHAIPGTKQPFDLYLGAWGNFPDPGTMTAAFDSRLITGPTRPDGNANDMIGFRDPEVDRLIDAALATYDKAERARIYRALQEVLAAQQPELFLWSPWQFGAVTSAVSTAGGSLDRTAPGWFCQPETLVVRLAGT
jgi:ABC-type transport system substrate-binding protein